jgi:hypothetical protein
MEVSKKWIEEHALSDAQIQALRSDMERHTHTTAITDVSSAHDVLRHPLGLIETSDSLLKKNQDKPLTQEFLTAVSGGRIG